MQTYIGGSMQKYIGTKIIQAEEMHEVEFLREVKGQDTTNQKTRPGYHVVYGNPDGSMYHSWSPKDVFEAAYRPVPERERSFINQ